MLISVRRTGVASLALATSLLAVGTAGLASPASAGQARQHHHHHHHGRAVFVQTDDPSGNAVVAYDRHPDGSLTQAGVYPTGGRGGVLDGSVVDHLASQGSLTLDRAHHTLYAVNAGSDTVTAFGVRGDRLRRHAVVASGGDFPVSVTVHRGLVYVLNARQGGSIQGFRGLDHRLQPLHGSERALGLDATATPEFVNTPGQVAFSPSGRRLLVTTKANGNHVDVFSVGRSGLPSTAPTVNTLPGAVPFALTWTRHGHVALAEAGSNSVATFALSRVGVLHGIATTGTGQAATCWIVRSGDQVYASNAGSGTLSGYHVQGGGLLTSLGTTGTDPGTVDATVTPDGRYLYAQAGKNGQVDAFRIGRGGSLTPIGSVTVPGAVGGEGIATS